MNKDENSKNLDAIDHVAITVTNIQESVSWWQNNFQCQVLYQDETWALMQFANIKLALVMPAEHPAHLSFVRSDAQNFGPPVKHRDGTFSVYSKDPFGNVCEFMLPGHKQA